MNHDNDELAELSVAKYDAGWENQWDDMKNFGPFSRHLRRLIIKLIRLLEFQSVLDVGCGQGVFLTELQSVFSHVQPFGLDISPAAIDLAQSRVHGGQFWNMDLVKEHINRRFDLVICSEVLEHIKDDTAALKHLSAMTGKYLIVTTPQGRMRLSELVMGHVRNYRYGELVQKLEQAGFKVIRVVEWGFPFYSPLYRDLLNLIGNQGTMGKYGLVRKTISKMLYNLFLLNSSRRGDEILVLAEPAVSTSSMG